MKFKKLYLLRLDYFRIEEIIFGEVFRLRIVLEQHLSLDLLEALPVMAMLARQSLKAWLVSSLALALSAQLALCVLVDNLRP